MALKNLFDMVKADRYTADGREEIIKAQEAETEDKVYNIGDISEKTGLQKTANGWVKPKNGKQPGKTNKPNPNGVVAQQKQKLEAEKHEAARRDAQAPSKKTEVNTPGLRKDVQEAIKRSSPEEIKAYIKELRTPGSRMSRYFDNPDLLANVYEDELNKMTESKPQPVSPTAQVEIAEMAMTQAAGLSPAELAKKYNISEADAKAVRKIMDDMNENARKDRATGEYPGKYSHTKNKPAAGSKLAAENKTTIRQGPNTKTLNETPAQHVQKNLDAYKGYQAYDMESLVLKPSGYERQTSARTPGGGQSVTYTKNGAEDITLFFDKNGELENADVAGSKPAAQEVKLGGGADTYYFEDPDNMSNEDKVFKSLGIELAETFGDHDGRPGNTETWANGWLDNIMDNGGLGIKSKKTRQPAAPVPADEVMRIVEENPARWDRIIGNAKKFYEGKGRSTDFESDEFYPIKLVGGKTKPSAQYYAEGKRNEKNNPLTGKYVTQRQNTSKDAAPRVLTGDTRIRVRKA